MSQPKPPARIRKRPNASELNGAVKTDEVFSLAEAAAYLRLSESDVLRLVDEQSLPARRIDKKWRFLKTAIQRWLGRESTTVEAAKAAQLAVAGAWKNDPFVEEELRETYERRRTLLVGDES